MNGLVSMQAMTSKMIIKDIRLSCAKISAFYSFPSPLFTFL